MFILKVIFWTVILAIIILYLHDYQPSKPISYPENERAIDACSTFIKRALEDTQDDLRILEDTADTQEIEPHLWLVKMNIVVRNGFNAKIKVLMLCKLQLEKDNWNSLLVTQIN
jgi:hypothetical protein